MSPETYKAALKQAKKELEIAVEELGDLLKKENEAEHRIVELRQTVAVLSKLCGEPYEDADALGLTDAVRLALKTAAVEMYPNGVKGRMESMGFNTSSYGNIMASIHTILKRLKEQGQVEEVRMPGSDKPAYRWIPKKISL
jgi:hypothetical protein